MAIARSDPTSEFFPALARNDVDSVLAMFAGEPVIDDPRHGHVAGTDAVREYVHAQAAWIREHELMTAQLRTTIGRGRSLAESEAELMVGGVPTQLPIAVVADRTGGRTDKAVAVGHAGRGDVEAIRVYHSTWPLEGSHRLRPPIIAEDPNLVLPDVVAEYMDALGSANLAKSQSVFEADGYFREPSGGPHVYRGPEGIKTAYGAFYEVGPIHLLHCSVIDDGVACGVEFIAIGWGPRRFEPQAGIGVYERGRSGRLAAARVYDDVDVDLGLQP